VWCDVVWCDVVWCAVVWCAVVWCDVVWCDVVWCDVVWCGVVWCGVLILNLCLLLVCRLANPVDLVKVQQQAVVGHHPDIRNGRTFAMLHQIYLNQGVSGRFSITAMESVYYCTLEWLLYISG
jgi:hypothetical protein